MIVQNRLAHVRLSIEPIDTAQLWTAFSAFGLAAAVLLALIGGSPVDIPMPTHLVGLVTPTCGLTRGSTALVRGDASLAWSYNPLSFAVVALGLIGVIRAGIGVVAARWLSLALSVGAVGRVVLFSLGVLLWVYQQGNADFIMTSRA